jgi:hypothetical protein
MKRGISLAVAVVFGFVLMAGAGSAFAALAVPIQVKVPFDFIVGNTTLPAGMYLISSPSDTATGMIMIRSEAGKPAVFVEAELLSPKGDAWASQTRLTFNKVNGKEYLSRIWESGSDVGYALQPSASELKAEQASHSGGK